MSVSIPIVISISTLQVYSTFPAIQNAFLGPGVISLGFDGPDGGNGREAFWSCPALALTMTDDGKDDAQYPEKGISLDEKDSRRLISTSIHQKTRRRSEQFKWIVFLVLSFLILVHIGYNSFSLLPHKPCSLTAETQEWDTNQVTFDNYSLILRGQRIFLQCVYLPCISPSLIDVISSGEFHTFRLPVVDLWPDILQKFKAAGMNAVSLYTHMGIINPSRGVQDFDDWRALKPFYEACMAAGIWVVLRPGALLEQRD